MEELQIILNPIINTIGTWIEEHGLKLDIKKIQIEFLTNKRVITVKIMRINDEAIEAKKV